MNIEKALRSFKFWHWAAYESGKDWSEDRFTPEMGKACQKEMEDREDKAYTRYVLSHGDRR